MKSSKEKSSYQEALASIEEKNSYREKEYKAAQKVVDKAEELAEKMGRDPKAVSDSVDRYNDFCAQGEDMDCQRDPSTLVAIQQPPYYAVEITPGLVCTTGGGKRSINGEVLDYKGIPIPGLYEAGELGSMFSGLYQNGSFLSECIISGRTAGRAAVQRVVS